jgi:hypothetical protein
MCVCVYVLLSLIVSGFFCRLRYSLWKRTDWDKWYYTKKLISRKMSNNSNSDRPIVICFLFVTVEVRFGTCQVVCDRWIVFYFTFFFFSFLFFILVFLSLACILGHVYQNSSNPSFFFCSLSSSPFFSYLFVKYRTTKNMILHVIIREEKISLSA